MKTNTSIFAVMALVWISVTSIGCVKFETIPAKVPKAVTINDDLTAPTYSDHVKALTWTTRSPVGPFEYLYSVEYKADLEAKTLAIDVTRGSMVTETLPTPATKTLTEAQVREIRVLIEKVAHQACSGSLLVGGELRVVSFWTDPSQEADFNVYGRSCGGLLDPKGREAVSGLDDLTIYMSSL